MLGCSQPTIVGGVTLPVRLRGDMLAWSPEVAGVAAAAAVLLPVWACAVLWAVGIAAAFPVPRVRLVVPCALAGFTVGWSLSAVLVLAVAGTAVS